MARSIEQLRAASDEELIQEHDALAKNTGYGVDYVLAELDRRDRARGEQAALALARASNRLAVISVVVSTLALVVTVIAVVAGR